MFLRNPFGARRGWGALCVVVLAPCLAVANGVADPPTISILLEDDTLFIGEMPKVLLIVKAPAKRDIAILTETAISDRDYVSIDIMDSNGKRIPGGPDDTQHAATGFVRRLQPLPHSESAIVVLPSLARPRSAGRYTVGVKCKPTGESDLVIEKNLLLNVTDIKAEAIAASKVMLLPESKSMDEHPARVELLNVKTQKGHELVYKVSKTHEVITERLTQLDAESKIIAVPRGFRPFGFEREIWAAFEKDDLLFFVRVNYVSGKVLEHRQIHDGTHTR